MISVHQFRGICFTRIGQRRLMSATNYIIFDGANNFQSKPSISQCTFHLQYSPEKKPVRHASTRFPSFRRVEGQHTCRRHQENRRHFSTFTKSEYIHPLSQIVLEHLQSHHSRWVTEMGLDTGLKLNKDGTFVLCFPGAGFGGFATNNDKGSVEESSAEGVPSPSNGSIWTMYEPSEKKHYLCVTRGSVVGRYMLQDNTKPAWHSDKRSTPERVQDAVDEMIEKMREIGNDVGKS